MSALTEQIKEHAQSRLDREASIHYSDHQNVHARRYVVPKPGDTGAEVMIIIKGDNLQLWCEADALNSAFATSVNGEFRPGSETYSVPSPSGGMRYGRHSGLKSMGRLHQGDAWRFVPKTIGDLDRILDAIGGRGSP